MTALSAERSTNKYSPNPMPDHIVVNVAASTKIYKGALVGIDINGRAVAGTSVAASRVIGRAEETVDNSSGAADAKTVKVNIGVFYFANSSSTDAITSAHIGRDCYVVDDQTVALTPGSGAYRRAGTIVAVDSAMGGVAVFVGWFADQQELVFLAAADLRSYQYSAVKKDNGAGTVALAGAGEFACGILQNAPNTGEVAIVKVGGISIMKADGTGVTRGDKISCAANGLGRASTAAGTGALAYVNTSDAGAAQDPVVAASILGQALTTAAASATFYVLLTHSGAVGATAA